MWHLTACYCLAPPYKLDLFILPLTLHNGTLCDISLWHPVVDPGFPVGGAWTCYGGHGPLTWVLFTENVCENERIWSHRVGMCQAHPLDLPMAPLDLVLSHNTSGCPSLINGADVITESGL